jgi:hypothetical protein
MYLMVVVAVVSVFVAEPAPPLLPQDTHSKPLITGSASKKMTGFMVLFLVFN